MKNPTLLTRSGAAFGGAFVNAENRVRNEARSERQLWFRILESQMETGTPYMLYKDHANRKSNQQNLGIRKHG